MRKSSLRLFVLTAIFTAMTTVLTFCIKIPVQNGYLHLGDGIICLAACVLPSPAAILCGALGGCLSDLLSGYTQYVIPTLIIKGLITITFSSKSPRFICKRNVLSLLFAAEITVGGYYIADAVILAYSQSSSFVGFLGALSEPIPWISAAYGLVGNLIQSVASACVFVFLGTALDKIKFKNRLEEK